jgi:hypothetical protein
MSAIIQGPRESPETWAPLQGKTRSRVEIVLTFSFQSHHPFGQVRRQQLLYTELRQMLTGVTAAQTFNQGQRWTAASAASNLHLKSSFNSFRNARARSQGLKYSAAIQNW